MTGRVSGWIWLMSGQKHILFEILQTQGKKRCSFALKLEIFEPEEGSHPCDLSKSSDDEVVNDDDTPGEIDEGGPRLYS